MSKLRIDPKKFQEQKSEVQQDFKKIERLRAGQIPKHALNELQQHQFEEDDDELNEDDIFPEMKSKKSLHDINSLSSKSFALTQTQQHDLESVISHDQAHRDQTIPSRIIERTSIVGGDNEALQQSQEFKAPKQKHKKEVTSQSKQEEVVEVKKNVQEETISRDFSRREFMRKKLLEQEKTEKTDQLKKIEEEKMEIEENKNKPLYSDDEDLGMSKQKSKQNGDGVEKGMDQEDEDNDYDDEEEEEDEEEHQRGLLAVLKPVFISKEARDTQNKQIDEQIAIEEEKKKLQKQRKQEAKMLAIEAKRTKDEDENEEKSDTDQFVMPNDDDNADEAQELELWKIRELKRIKRDRDERQKLEKEKKEIERRRNLTDEQREFENKKLGSDKTNIKEKTSMRFMQKYYHKGAFYLDKDDPLFSRDYNTGVGEDLYDRSQLPKYYQKRRGNIGQAGQSKYTHLTDQDTSNFDPYYKIDQNIFKKQISKTAGYKGENVMEKTQLKKV